MSNVPPMTPQAMKSGNNPARLVMAMVESTACTVTIISVGAVVGLADGARDGAKDGARDGGREGGRGGTYSFFATVVVPTIATCTVELIWPLNSEVNSCASEQVLLPAAQSCWIVF